MCGAGHKFAHVALSTNGVTLFAATRNSSTLMMWDMVTGKCTRMLEHPDGASAGAINGIAVSPDDEVVACIHNSVCCRAVRIIDAHGMSRVSEFFAQFPTEVRFASGQPKVILVVCKHFRASAWDVKECDDRLMFEARFTKESIQPIFLQMGMQWLPRRRPSCFGTVTAVC